MSASLAKARSGYGTKFQMGDGAAPHTVTVGAGGAAIGATTVPVTATTGPLSTGDILIFGIGKIAELTAAAATGALSLTVKPLTKALLAGDTAVGGEAFATLGEMTDFTPPAPSTSVFETTHYQSPGGAIQRAAGMTDPGTSSASFNWNPKDPTQDGATGLYKAFRDKQLRNFRIIYPFEPVVIDSFAGLVTSYPVTAPLNDRMTGSCEIQIAGDILRS